jgi:hypothetical protein
MTTPTPQEPKPAAPLQHEVNYQAFLATSIDRELAKAGDVAGAGPAEIDHQRRIVTLAWIRVTLNDPSNDGAKLATSIRTILARLDAALGR